VNRAAKWICAGCVCETHLKGQIQTSGEAQRCSYCAAVAPCYSIGQLAEIVDRAFRQHFRRTDDEPDFYEGMLRADSELDYEWERQGEPVEEVIAREVGLDEEAGSDLLAVLADHYAESTSGVSETEYSPGSHYEEASQDSRRWHRDWREFEDSLKSESRFFNDKAAKVLASVFDGIEGMQTWGNEPLVVRAGHGTEFERVYRARVFQSREKLKAALGRPDLEIGSPPSAMATAGRMNAKGISVFYAATEAEVAIAEVRPPVGSQVAVATFEIIRPLLLLDLAALQRVIVRGSYFDPVYAESVSRAEFLRSLSDRMTRPVMPDDEAFEYLPTQAVADYLATRGIDGIVLPSVQAPGGPLSSARNVVLFHKAARVEALAIPRGTKVEVDDGHMTEEGWETNYSVSEEWPAEDQPMSSEDLLLANIEALKGDHDLREPALKVQPRSVVVHHIKGVQHSKDSFEVSRYGRVTPGEPRKF